MKRKKSTSEPARERLDNVVAAVRRGDCGGCPNPPAGCNYLKKEIDLFMCITMVRSREVVSVEVCNWYKREIRYVLKVCRSLGYEPRW